jgi:hypothetical protein
MGESMEKILKCTSIMFAVLYVLSSVTIAYAYHVKIVPADSSGSAYSMKVDEDVAFTVQAYSGEEGDVSLGEEIPIGKILWQFDYAYLKKTGAAGATLNLRAIKEGRVDLVATGTVGNYMFTKTIKVAIEK